MHIVREPLNNIEMDLRCCERATISESTFRSFTSPIMCCRDVFSNSEGHKTRISIDVIFGQRGRECGASLQLPNEPINITRLVDSWIEKHFFSTYNYLRCGAVQVRTYLILRSYWRRNRSKRERETPGHDDGIIFLLNN